MAYARVHEDPAYDPSAVFYGLQGSRGFDGSSGSCGSSGPTRSLPQSPSPRLVCVDAKGSVRRELPAEIDDDGVGDITVELWDGAVQDVASASRMPRQSASTSASAPAYFGDFMGVKPGRMHVLSTLTRGSREERAWSVHGERCPVHKEEMEAIEDSVRVMAERSDSLAGFVVTAEDSGVWGNVTSNVMEELRDDYRGKTVILFATREGDERIEEMRDGEDRSATARLMSEGLAVASLAPLVDLYVPVIGGSRDGSSLFRSSLAGAVGIFGATMPLVTGGRDGAPAIDMAGLANGLVAGHHRCPLATLDVFSPALTSPVSLSGHARADDVGRITEHVSLLRSRNATGGDAFLSEADREAFAALLSGEDVVLSHPSARTVSRIPAGVPVVRGMDAASGFRTGAASIPCAAVLGSTTAFGPELRELAGMFGPRQARDRAALLESWGVQGDADEVHEGLLSLAECFE